MKQSVASVRQSTRPVRSSRRKALALGGAGVAGLAFAVAGWFGASAYADTKVRERLAAAGAARGLDVTCEQVALRLGGVRVTGMVARTPADDTGVGLDARVDDVEVDVAWSGTPQQVRLRGVKMQVAGELDELRERFSRQSPFAAEKGPAHVLDVQVADAEIAWTSAAGTLRATGAETRLLADGARILSAQHVQFALAGIEVEANGLSVELADRLVRGARIDDLVLRQPAALAAPRPASPPSADVTLALPWPSPGAWRARLLALGERVAARLTEDALLRASGVRVELGRDLRFGPAPLRLQRRPGALVVELAPDDAPAAPSGSTSLAFHVDVPLGEGAGDPSATLEGGPVPLSLLGFRDGQMFLHGTSAATLRGRGKVILGEPLQVDLSIDVAHVGLEHPRLALTPVDDVSFGLDLRGSISARRQLAVEDVKFRLGELTVQAHGTLAGGEQDALLGHGFVEVAHVGCEGLHQAVPPALAPRLAEFRFAGDFAFSAALDFDTQRLDDLSLDVRQMGTCRSQATPEWAARRHLQDVFTHTVYDPQGKPRDETTGPGSGNWTPVDRISPYMQVAVLTSEDGSFFHHHGWNKGAIRRALIANLKAGQFRQGASTISMQLSKNLFLSRDKTLSRKLEELVLTDYLEQTFDKSEMMELYLNVIEFGPNVYGITQAARFYFGREPEELQLAECMFLTSILPSPVKRSRAREKRELAAGARGGVDFLIRAAEKTGKISRAEMQEGLAQSIVFHLEGQRPVPRPPVHGSRFEGDAVDDEGFLPLE